MADLSKDPDEILDYGFDWDPALEDGEEIDTSEWRIRPDDPQGVQVASKGDTAYPTATTVWLEGGKNHKTYVVTNEVTTTKGRTYNRSFELSVDEK